MKFGWMMFALMFALMFVSLPSLVVFGPIGFISNIVTMVFMVFIMMMVSKLFASNREVKINIHQCCMLADRIDGMAIWVNALKRVLKVKEFSKVRKSFLIIRKRAEALISECGGTEWVKTALIRGNNKEAFAEVHRELSNFFSKIESNYVVSMNLKPPPPMNLKTHLLDEELAERDMQDMLDEEAERDMLDMLEMLKAVEKVSTSNAAAEGDELKSRKDEERTKCKLCCVYIYCYFTKLFKLQKPISDFPSGASNLEQIIEVVSAKRKDQASNHAQDEQDLSAIYLRIPRSEIVLKRLIGTGSYGDVHEAEWLGCKMCLKDFPWSGGYGEQWLKQAMPILKLRHPNVLQLVGFSPSEVDSEKPKVLTEIMQGDIRSLIDRRMKEQNGKGTPFTWCMTLDIMIQVARGLACMHQNGFMHGDRVLTTNIIIKVCGDYIDARIGDFGVPEDIPVEHVHIYEPRMGDPQGAETARWMAPEVCAGSEYYTTKSDIYSFGILCSELLTSRKPFDHHANVAAVHSQIVAGVLRPELPGDLDKRVADIIRSCWHADSSKRPDAQTIVDELEKIQFSKSPTA
ncbi:hypothetical protein KC19_10G180000 [Ceratodon purpureus]|uniref:Protein kinase domain-containing protein n=1 Tax=Ceratodon purpureus TaxID=3225 RepID=A0A8T0GRW9_CERPU|nr:hypothetical protein KC19_10G180000 [Ceratodon purpureus]